ncbi:hypothetical protein ACR52_21360 [Pseudomonas fildesensis]|uniref:Uncharacterized protein n=2 Tax=Pseudomonas fildesensis TaxID=1674920 RepID=A0A0J8FYY6_9PSED|nr:hypothetical protein ACR52_21360 [Pseudomonas fildesensis]
MGQSNTIKEQQEKNAEFQKYVDGMRADLNKIQAEQTQILDKHVKEHYSKYKDDASMISSSYQHLTTVSEWSLASVNVMIDSCRDTIFGKKLPVDPKKDKPPAEVNIAIKAMTNLELLIANAAFDVIQGLLTSAGSKTETGISIKYDKKMLVPGMTLFIIVMENSYQSKDFFSNESIIQTLFLFDVRFSIKEGKGMSELNDLQAYEEQKQVFRNQLRKLGNDFNDLDTKASDYLTSLAKFTEISDVLNKRLGSINKLLQELNPLAGPALNGVGSELGGLPDTEKQEGDAIVSRIKRQFHTALAARP